MDNSPRFVPLGEAVKRKYPGAYDDIDSGQLGKIVETQYPGIYDDLIEPGIPEEPGPEGLGGLKGLRSEPPKGYRALQKSSRFRLKNTDNPDFNPFGNYSKVMGKINESYLKPILNQKEQQKNFDLALSRYLNSLYQRVELPEQAKPLMQESKG